MMKNILIALFLLQFALVNSQETKPENYWNSKTQLIPWRYPIASALTKTQYIDADKDGDPDIIRQFVHDSIPVMWIDDDDDMKMGDLEGDTDNDCLLIDRNRDGKFAGPYDFSIDWGDEDGDGIPEIQLIAQNGGLKNRNFFDWEADFMYFIDLEKDNIKHFVNWNDIRMQAWEHIGHSNFFEDYHGNTLFLKMHASTFRIDDMRYSWENPFIFYDTDKDGLSEWTIRLVDTPKFRPKEGTNPAFEKLDKEIDVQYTKKIDWVGIGWDLDNDNGQGNEFDFDFTLRFNGPGFDYSDQVHKFKSLRGLDVGTELMYDSRWRKLDELIYADHNTAWNLIFNKGEWTECRLSFDEDDDCNRWERVELYDPKDLFAIGRNSGGIDHNAQADAAGDRGEWDTDFSGKGNLYIGTFDGRVHLLGAEWGAWRIDQSAYSFQGFGGLYDRWRGGRIQREPKEFATVKYNDTDNNGFIDVIAYDLNGDKVFEDSVSLKALGIDDRQSVITTKNMTYPQLQKLFTDITNKNWSRAQEAIKIAKSMGINPDWYAFYMKPRTLAEKYDFGFWLNFYLYQDMRFNAKAKKNQELVNKIDGAYYSGNWAITK